jgi:hypothetical protein
MDQLEYSKKSVRPAEGLPRDVAVRKINTTLQVERNEEEEGKKYTLYIVKYIYIYIQN